MLINTQHSLKQVVPNKREACRFPSLNEWQMQISFGAFVLMTKS